MMQQSVGELQVQKKINTKTGTEEKAWNTSTKNVNNNYETDGQCNWYLTDYSSGCDGYLFSATAMGDSLF